MDYAINLLDEIGNPYMLLALLLLFVIFVAWVIQRIGLPMAMRYTEKIPVANAILHNIDRPLSYALPLFLMQLVVRGAPDNLAGIVGIRHLASVLLILALTWLLVRATRGVAEAVGAHYRIDVEDNLRARAVLTQTRLLMRTMMVVIVILGFSAVLMTFPSVRTIGAGLLASAGVIGLAIGMAAKPVLGNLIAGMQLALTQPIRIDDVLIVKGEFGRVEEITGTYVVMHLWDHRRLIVPLQWFIENPFENWTRRSADLIGAVTWWVDYRMPLEPLKQEVRRLCESAPQWWDGQVAGLQVVDSGEQAMQLRALISAGSSGSAWDLRCHVRAGIIDFIQREYPEFLPRVRTESPVAGAAQLGEAVVGN